MRHIPPLAEEGAKRELDRAKPHAKREPDRAKPELKLGETFSPN